MAHSIEFRVSARKQLADLPKELFARVLKAIGALADDPRPAGCRKLKGWDAYRIRVGDYRIVYEIHDDVLVVLIVRVATAGKFTGTESHRESRPSRSRDISAGKCRKSYET